MNYFSLKEALQKYPTCQARRGLYKQWVFFINEDYIVKGPYETQLMKKIIQRAEKFKEWNMKNISLPISVSQTIDYVEGSNSKKTGDESYFIWYNNIGQKLQNCVLHKESWDPYITYSVMEGGNIKELSEVVASEPKWLERQIGEIIYSVIGMKLLDVGDTGLYNIIVNVDTEQINIIDYDQNKADFTSREDFYFSKPIKIDLREKWLRMARPYYPLIIERLKWIAQKEPVYQVKIDAYIMALSPTAAHIQISTTGNVIPADVLKSPIINSNGTGQTMQIVANHNIPNIGRMEYKSMFRAIGYTGYKIDILKSGLQKYIRRDIPDKAVICFVEAYRIGDFPGADGIKTNIFNRLAVIAAEDICIANPALALNVIYMVLTRVKQPSSLLEVANFCACVQALAESYKTRISSHASYCFSNPEGIQEMIKRGILIETTYDNALPQLTWYNEDPQEIRLIAAMFAKRLNERNYSAITWLFYFLNSFEKTKVKGRTRRFFNDSKKRMTAPVVLWEILEKHLQPHVCQVLEEAYFTMSKSAKMNNKKPFIMMAVMLVIFDIKDVGNFNIEEYTNPWQRSNLPAQLYEGKYNLIIDNFVVDKHTSEGLRHGADIDLFRTVGAIVQPEDERFINNTLKDIYTNRNNKDLPEEDEEETILDN